MKPEAVPPEAVPPAPVKREQSSGHRIFVLTFWLEEDDELDNSNAWRFRLEEPRNGKRKGCVGLDSMVELLSGEIAGDVRATPKKSSRPK